MNETNPSTEMNVTENKRPYSLLAFASLFIGVASFILMGKWFYRHPNRVLFVCVGGIVFAVVAGCRLVLAKRRGWAGVIAGGVLCVISLYSQYPLQKAKAVSDRITCAEQLNAISQAIQTYQADHDGFNPPTLETLVTLDMISSGLLTCPGSDDQMGGSSYIYRGGDLTNKVRSSMILAYDKPENHSDHILNVLYSDGRVMKYDESEFWHLIEEDNELRKEQGFAEKPMEITPRWDREGGEYFDTDSQESMP